MFDDSFLAALQWSSEHGARLALAAAAVALVGEAWQRRRRADGRKGWPQAWVTNGALLGCSLLLGALLTPFVAPWLNAALSGEHGVLASTGLSLAWRAVVGVLLLDLIGYGLHVALHRWPVGWRVHQVHHSDAAMNASTHFRQHPLQSLLILALQLPLLYVLGIPGLSWAMYEVLALVVQLWQHAEGAAGGRLDRWLRPVLVTPALHRIHHHPERRLHDSNYGNVFSFWDRLFRTMTVPPALPSSPSATAAPQPVGLLDWPDQTASGIAQALVMPFVSPPGPRAAPPRTVVQRRGKRHN